MASSELEWLKLATFFSGDRDAEGAGELRLYGSSLVLKDAFDGFIMNLVDDCIFGTVASSSGPEMNMGTHE